jgi:hypothetical protein
MYTWSGNSFYVRLAALILDDADDDMKNKCIENVLQFCRIFT